MGLPPEEAERLLKLINRLEDIRAERETNRRRKKNIVMAIANDFKHEYINWFEKEAEITGETISILEEMLPWENFDKDKSTLNKLLDRHKEVKEGLDELILSVEQEKIENFSDISEVLIKQTFPSLGSAEKRSGIISDILQISVELEQLVGSLDERIRYLQYSRRLIEIMMSRE